MKNWNLWQATNEWLDDNPYASTHERNEVRWTLERTKDSLHRVTNDSSDNLESDENIDKKTKGIFDLLVRLSKKYDISKFLPEQLQPISKKITGYVLSWDYVWYYRLITPFLKRNPALILTISELLFENFKKSNNWLWKENNQEKQGDQEKEKTIDPRIALLIKHFWKQIILKIKK